MLAVPVTVSIAKRPLPSYDLGTAVTSDRPICARPALNSGLIIRCRRASALSADSVPHG